jgi:hypothetical protein
MTAPEEELVTEEEVEAAEVTDSEAVAKTAAPKLQAAVRSEGRKAGGKLDMSQPLIAAAARHLRAITPNGFKKVYKQGGAVIDDKATAEASEFLDQVRSAYHKVVETSDVVSNLLLNVAGFKVDVDEFTFDPDNTEDYEGIRQVADYQTLQDKRAELKVALDEFVDLVGGETNANAINAVIKKLNENKYAADTKGVRNKMDFAREVFGRDKNNFLRKGENKLTSKQNFTEQADIAFSSALRSYINGELDESFDIAPKGREVRPNLKNRARFKKAEDKGVKLSSKQLEDAYTGGRLSFGRTPEGLETNLANARERYELKIEDLDSRLADGLIEQKAYDKQVKTAEKNLAKAEASFEKQTAELEQSKGLEGLVARALDAADPTLTGKMLRKATATILRKIPKDLQPTVNFADVDKSFYDPKKGKGGEITLRRSVSPEEVAHEVLHSLLQGVVYRNRDANLKSADKKIVPTVEVLRGYVRQLISTDLDQINLDPTTKAKASEVVSELRSLVNRGDKMGEVDAILELVSYGNTMRDFKLLLNQLPKTRNAATANWKAVVRGIWEQIRRLLNLALGKGIQDRASNDILDASIDLLNRVSEDVTRARPEKRLSSPLKQSVRSDSVPLNGTVNPAEFNIDLRNEVAGKDWVLSSKVIFDLLGWDKRMKWGGERLTKLNTYIKKNLPR